MKASAEHDHRKNNRKGRWVTATRKLKLDVVIVRMTETRDIHYHWTTKRVCGLPSREAL